MPLGYCYHQTRISLYLLNLMDGEFLSRHDSPIGIIIGILGKFCLDRLKCITPERRGVFGSLYLFDLPLSGIIFPKSVGELHADAVLSKSGYNVKLTHLVSLRLFATDRRDSGRGVVDLE